MMSYHSSQAPMVIHHHLFRASLLFVALLSTLSLPLLSLLLLFSNIMFMYKNRFAQKPNKLLSENEPTFEHKSRDDKALHQAQVKSMDDNDSISCDIFEVDSCWSLESISEDVEEEEEDCLIEIALVPEWRKNKHLERERESQVDDLASEMSGEEENLIEIDISMGSITQPTAHTLS